MPRFLPHFLAIFCLFHPLLGAAAEGKKKLTVATLEWPPYTSSEMSGQGYVIAVVKRIFEEAGYEIDVKFLPWARVLRELEKGSIDVAASAYPNDERNRKYLMSKPYAHAPLGFFKMKDRVITFSKVEDLKPYTIGVGRGYAHTPEFDHAYFLKKEVVSRVEQNFLKLIAGRIDLAAGDKANGFYVLSKLISETSDPKKKKALAQIEFLQPALVDFTLHVLISRKIPNAETILKDFNAALTRLKAKDEIRAIEKRYGF